MLNVAGIVYLGSRVTAAAGNLLALMIFTRWAGPAEYGQYLLIFAWSVIVYGFGAQWMRYAYFGVYHTRRIDEYVASLVRLLAVGLVIAAIVLASLGAVGIFEPGFFAAVLALVCGMTVYEAAFEVARTLLKARSTALSMLLRTSCTLAFGSASLWLGGGARALALAIATAHVVAAVPSLATFSSIRISQGSRAASLHILSYGWPLLLSFGINAVAGSMDRLMLAHYLGAAILGPYGVVADVLRQSFAVFGETIAFSLITVAKTNANQGNFDAANDTLRKSFNACLTVAVFGAAFFIVFGGVALRMILKPEFIAPTQDLIPIFAIAVAFATMHNFYFAQVIYFTHASYLGLVISILSMVVSTGLSVLLVPSYGAHGAAFALMGANILSCIAFMVLGRRWYRLPIDLAGLGEISLLGILFLVFAQFSAHLFAAPTAVLISNALAFVLLAAVAVHRFALWSKTPHRLAGARTPVG